MIPRMKRALAVVVSLGFTFSCGSDKGKRCSGTSEQCPGKQVCWCENAECVDENNRPNGECVSQKEFERRALKVLTKPGLNDPR